MGFSGVKGGESAEAPSRRLQSVGDAGLPHSLTGSPIQLLGPGVLFSSISGKDSISSLGAKNKELF